MKIHAIALVLLAASTTGCHSPSSALQRLAREQHDDLSVRVTSGDEARELEARSHERALRVRELLADPEANKASDQLNAALVLVQSNDETDLVEAQKAGLKAAELGDNRGFRVAAEALDKQMMKQGKMQRYGTQFVWEPVLHAWRLYNTDPRTTDEERRAMGVPPMAQLLEQEKLLNERQKKTDARH